VNSIIGIYDTAELRSAVTAIADAQAGPTEGDTVDTVAGVASTVRFDARILHALRRIIRGFALYSKEILATSHITAPQLVCLLAVVESGPLTATAIGRRVHLSASTVVGILDRLEEKGLIARTRDDEDRRVVMVSATAQGIRLSKDAPSPLQQTLAKRLGALPELEQAAIALALERVVDLMNAQPDDAASASSGHSDGLPAP